MRQLVTIRTISELIPIDGADFIELAKVDGWQCIVKKGDFKVGDKGLYFEIDSMIPADDKRFEFLGRGQVRTHYRIKTMRMRKQLSQGLLMPTSILTFDEAEQLMLSPLQDIATLLRVEKYEPALSITGEQKGTFPTDLIPKTDQERVQNMPRELEGRTAQEFEITEKLDGTSCTFYYCQFAGLSSLEATTTGVYTRMGACSRNWEMKLDDDNIYARLFKDLQLEKKLSELVRDAVAEELGYNDGVKYVRNLAIQGEIIGPKIQGNKYQRANQEFYVFDIYDIDAKKHLSPTERHALVKELGLLHVPCMLTDNFPLDLDAVLELAEGPSWLADIQREGVVFKEENGPLTFKAISNKFLLKNNV